MLYYNFNGYEGFKEVFGIMEHGNGNRSRRNKILLAMMKDKQFFNDIRTKPLKPCFGMDLNKEKRETLVQDFRNIRNMSELRAFCLDLFRTFEPTDGWDCNISFDGGEYRFAHEDYEIDNNGLCYDGDTRSVRYINHASNGNTYKMKSGKFMRRLIDASPWSILPEQVKVWLCEDFAERWQAYSQSKCTGHTLHISNEPDDFRRIYDSDNYESDFGSCMSHDGGDHAQFYWDAVKAKAAWLENNEGMITARCVIFTDVKDEEGKKWRLAERQYSSDGDNILKRVLVDKLISAGEIDAYKQVGVDCHNSRAWVANDGTSLSDKRFSIDCELNDGDILSYQDSFKWYCYEKHIAYNYAAPDAEDRLDETDLYYQAHYGKVWSDYEDGWIDEGDAVYVDSRSDYFRYDDTRYCENTDTREFCDDCVRLANGDYAYYGYECEGADGVTYCDRCNEYYLDTDMEYSELLDEWMCHDCRQEAEQEYMEEHAEDEGYRFDFYYEDWYDPEVCDDKEVLVWDFQTGTRVKKFSRRDYFAEYNGVYYYSHIAFVKIGDEIVRVPEEFTKEVKNEDGGFDIVLVA